MYQRLATTVTFTAILLLLPTALLAQLTWDTVPGAVGPGNGTITGGAGNWNLTDGNWTNDGGANNVAWTNGNSATFEDVGGAVTVNGAVSATTVTVNSTGYTFGGASALTITSGITANESTSFANPLTLSGAQTWTVAAGKTLGISGTATANNNISVSGGGTVAVSGSGGKFGGNTGFSIGANTTFSLQSGFNLISIPSNFTILAGGALAADAAGSNAHNIGALDLQGGSVTSANANHGGFGNFILNGDAANVSHSGNTQSVISASLIDIGSGGNGVRTFNVADGTPTTDLSISSALQGTRAMTKTGDGTMLLTGSSTFTGNINVNGGLLITGTGAGGVANLGSRTAARTIAVNTGATLELPGTYRLATGGNVVPGSSMTIVGGTLRNSSTVSAQFDVINNLTMRNGATLTANSSNYGASYQAFQLRGNVTVANTGGNTSPSSIVGGTGTNRGLHLDTNTIFDVDDVTGDAAADLTISTELRNRNGDLGGAGGLTKNGTGRMNLSAVSDFTGGTIVNNGTLGLGVAGGAGVGAIRGTLTINASSTVVTSVANALGYTAGSKVNTIDINGGLLDNTAGGDQGWGLTVNLTGGTMRSNGGTSSASTTQLFSLGGGSAINSLASATTSNVQGRINLREGNASNRLVFTVADGAAATDLLVSAAITQSAAGYGITKEGSGVMQLSGANSYSGGTTVNAGTLTVSASQASATGAISVASGAFLRTTHTGFNTWGNPSPTMTIAGTLSADAASNNAHNLGTLNLNGGTLTSINGLAGPANDGGFGNWVLRNVVVGGSAASTINSTTVQIATGFSFNVADVVSGPDLLVASQITGGTSPVTKTGAGTMKLTGANTNGGLTTITAGTLLVSNTSGSGVGTNNVSINGGTLGGVGLLGTAGDASNVSFTAAGGTIAPGESPGILTVFGDVDFTSAGTKTFAVELNGLAVGTQYDQLVVNSATGGTNTINLANALLSVSLGFTPSLNDQFTILLNNTPSAVAGTFNGLANNDTFVVNTTTFRINYDAGTGNDVVLTVVPEPSSLAMLVFGMMWLWLFYRKR